MGSISAVFGANTEVLNCVVKCLEFDSIGSYEKNFHEKNI